MTLSYIVSFWGVNLIVITAENAGHAEFMVYFLCVICELSGYYFENRDFTKCT